MRSRGDHEWRFMDITVDDGPSNMAIDEAMLNACIAGSAPNTVRLYQWSPSTVTIGRHQAVHLEVDLEEIERRKFGLVRRITGGGAVLHAAGKEITYSVVARVNELMENFPGLKNNVDHVYTAIMSMFQSALAKLSLSPARGTVHCPALFLDGKKISGNAQAIKKGVVLQHGTFLLTVDPQEMYSVLKPPEGITKGRMVRSVKAKVVGLEEHLGRKVEPEAFSTACSETFSETLRTPLVHAQLSGEEKGMVKALRQKYSSKEWLMKYP